MVALVYSWGMTLSERIREARVTAGLKQAQLADIVGVRPQTIWRIEAGQQRPSLEVASRIAQALSVSLDQLLESEPIHMVLRHSTRLPIHPRPVR